MKPFDEGEIFALPEKPFLLIYKSGEDGLNVAWFASEEDLRECVEEVRGYGCEIIDATGGRHCEINLDFLDNNIVR